MKNYLRLVFSLLLAVAILECTPPGGGSTPPAAPAISVTANGIARSVTLSCATSGATIYYTMDGTTPTTSSLQYKSALIVAGMGVSKTINAIAVLSGTSSSVSTQTVSIPFSTLSLAGTVSTLAGSGSAGNTDGTGTGASFNGPSYITNDGTNLYVTDWHNSSIRKIVIATGVVTTLAQAPYLMGITTDGTDLYAADEVDNKIIKVEIATGNVTTFAGGSQGSTNGIGTAASFNSPVGITTDGTNLYVTEMSNADIRKIAIATSTVTTFANGFSANAPTGIATDGSNIYMADGVNGYIWKISSSTVSYLSGFNVPRDVTLDGTYLYVADSNNHRICRVLISSGVSNLFVPGFSNPMGVTSDGIPLYVVDYNNNKIYKII
jgi:hypothetical protein